MQSLAVIEHWLEQYGCPTSNAEAIKWCHLANAVYWRTVPFTCVMASVQMHKFANKKTHVYTRARSKPISTNIIDQRIYIHFIYTHTRSIICYITETYNRYFRFYIILFMVGVDHRLNHWFNQHEKNEDFFQIILNLYLPDYSLYFCKFIVIILNNT